MELSNSFTVDVPLERAWEVLTDVPAIAPCLPGAQLQEVDGEEYRGIVKVKVGPITAQYKGAATFVECNETEHRLVLRAEGRETRGQGNASALITARLEAQGDRTDVVVDTDLTITGKVAQFGRGVMADVSGKLMGQFADNLAATVLVGDAAGGDAAGGDAAGGDAAGGDAAPGSPTAPTAAAAPAPEQADRFAPQPEPEPIDLLGTAGAPVARRLVPVVAAAVTLLAVLLFLRRRRS